VLSAEQNLKIKITLISRSEEYFLLADGHIAKLGNVKGSPSHLLPQKWSRARLQFAVAQVCSHRGLTEAY